MHTMDRTALARKNLDKRFAQMREVPMTVPPRGWIRAIRDALGLSTRQLAERMGSSQSWISVLEKSEVSGSTTLKSLRQAAEAMDCTLIYALIPTKSLAETLKHQAERIAADELSHLNHSMQLENQGMTSDNLVTERKRLVDELLAGPPRKLWNNK
jgi:predicted DNA-binding mobile mystery protein A